MTEEEFIDHLHRAWWCAQEKEVTTEISDTKLYIWHLLANFPWNFLVSAVDKMLDISKKIWKKLDDIIELSDDEIIREAQINGILKNFWADPTTIDPSFRDKL